jgi:ribonuclease PH
VKRIDGRTPEQVRPASVTHGIYKNADGSVLFELGNTKILCSVMLQDGVPHFLRGKGAGWLTAEYTMLPAATHTRTQREISTMRRNGRSIEISRLIGRSLRAIVDLKKLGERTIYIDCDVLQADGGTRTASITGAYCALRHAVEIWKLEGKVSGKFLLDTLGAVSVGLSDDKVLLDINYEEDRSIDADFNFVMTGSGKVVEIQGATESAPFEWAKVEQMRVLAQKGIKEILTQVDELELPEQSSSAHLSVSLGDLQKQR